MVCARAPELLLVTLDVSLGKHSTHFGPLLDEVKVDIVFLIGLLHVKDIGDLEGFFFLLCSMALVIGESPTAIRAEIVSAVFDFGVALRASRSFDYHLVSP